MSTVELQDGDLVVDAEIIAKGLGLDPRSVQEMMRAGSITSVCERGIGEDEGRFRVTFFTRSRRLRLVVDETGRVLQRSGIDFGDLPTRRNPAPTRQRP